MAGDPYSVLGVARGASDEEVRSAFRRLAKSCHPDLHPGDKAAADRFKSLSAAYDIVGDPERRRQYDAGLIDARGETVRHPYANSAGAYSGGTFSDVFNDFFADAAGHGARPNGRPGFHVRGQDVRYTLEVAFLDAISGTKKRVTMPEGGVLDLAVPEGVSDGQMLRLKGKGKPGFGGGEPGDALVEIHVKPHPDFQRSGDDIHMSLPVSLDEAVLGGKIEVATPTGRLQLTLPKGTSSGRVFRLKGKGVRCSATGKQGALLITVRIVMPDEIDEGLAYFISEWKKKHPYNPRG
ncbi:MAG: DnaJ C-terminal domain-containing protein [Hyphomicrobiaceae bacterium]